MFSKYSNLKINKWVIISVIGLLLLVAIIFAACSSNTPTPVVPTLAPPVDTNTPPPAPVVVDVNQLSANPWVLLGYGDPANPTVIAKGVAITLEFTGDGQLSGFSGCNNYSGTYQAATDGTLTVSALASTMMACEQGMDLETAYLSALQTARSFSFNSQGRLSIVYSDPSQPEEVLIFGISAKPLVNTNWILVSYGDPSRPYSSTCGHSDYSCFHP